MLRTAREAPRGMVFQVVSRGVGRMRLFLKDADVEAFERIIEKTLQSRPMRICAYYLMSNHWHFVLSPERDGDLAALMQKLTITHVRHGQDQRWLSDWPLPLPRPRTWRAPVNEPQTEGELEAIRRSVLRGQPYGGEGWVKTTAEKLGLQSTLRSRGRPRKNRSPRIDR